ncbi:MAG TPA: hypothetical protein VFD82_13205 [Planctomycetota bacterium]|nr:hypothetical protein [Planctomycetota bacterium]
MSAVLAGVLVGLRSQAAGSAGEVGRQPTFVRVLSAGGEPIANAVVTFIGNIPHLGAAAGPRDELQVASDARGRVMARLQEGLCYVAWAVGPGDDAGRGMLSPVLGYFGAGALLELRCTQRYKPRRLRVEGADAWDSLGPFDYFLVTATQGTETALVLEDGALSVPPGPDAFEDNAAHRSVIEVRCRDGQPLWTTPADEKVVAIPAPQSLAVRVVDENGAPLAGARVRHRVHRLLPWRTDGLGNGVVEDRFRELAKTDADGRAVVQVPYPADPLQEQNHGDLVLFAGAASRPQVSGGVYMRQLCMDDHKVDKVPGNELVFTCKRGEPLSGRWEPMPAGTVAHLSAVCKMLMVGGGFVHDSRAFVTTVDEQGKFVFDDVPAELDSCRLTVVPPADKPRVVPLFPAMPGRALPFEVNAGDGRATSVMVGSSLDVQITDPGGGPARGVVAFIAPADQRRVLFRYSLVRFPLDTRGAAALHLAPGNWIVVVVSAAGWAATQCALEPGEHEQVALAMEPLALMRVQLLDGDNRAIANAELELRGSRTKGTGDALQTILWNLQGRPQAQWRLLRTDAEGRIAIPFVPIAGVTRQLALRWEGGSTADFPLEAGADWLTVRPR